MHYVPLNQTGRDVILSECEPRSYFNTQIKTMARHQQKNIMNEDFYCLTFYCHSLSVKPWSVSMHTRLILWNWGRRMFLFKHSRSTMSQDQCLNEGILLSFSSLSLRCPTKLVCLACCLHVVVRPVFSLLFFFFFFWKYNGSVLVPSARGVKLECTMGWKKCKKNIDI